MTVHNFDERNTWSLAAGDERFWAAVYTKAFPSLVQCEAITDLKLQLLGVDRLLTLGNGIALTVDEKKRDRFDTGDILLEYEHRGGYNKPGWIEKEATIDYLAYAFIPSKRCYLFDWRMLRRAWCHYKDTWLVRYNHVPAKNRTYTTWSLAVPVDVLYTAVRTASIIEVDI